MKRLFLVIPVAVAELLTGCHCVTDYRSSRFETLVVSATDSILVSIDLYQWRGGTNQKSWGWLIDVREMGDSVVEARIVDSNEADPGRRVLGVLDGGYYPYKGVFRSYGADPYAGNIPYNEFWDRMTAGGLRLEIALESSALMVGNIRTVDETGWRESCTD